MAKGKSKGRGKPQYNIQVSRKVGDTYKRVSLTGLWKAGKEAPDGVVLSGSLTGEYLEAAAQFLTKAAAKDAAVYLNVWENDGAKKKRAAEDDEDEEKDEDEDDEKDEDEDEDADPF